MNDSQEPNNVQSSDSPPPKLPEANNIAGRYKRFVAAMIDGMIGMIVSLPVFNHFGLWEAVKTGQELPQSVSIGLAICSVAMFFVLHGYLLYQYGQTIGKRVIGLAIVTMDDKKPQFAVLILNRYLPQWVVGFFPGTIGPLLVIIDVVYIFFNKDHRCVHDLLAKTKVIDLSVKVTASPNSFVA